MLRRNKVPTLKMMCIRRLAFPATAETKFKVASKELAEMREVNKSRRRKYLAARAQLLKSMQMKHKGSRDFGTDALSMCVEAIINGWIRLSAYYGTSLEEWHEISHLFVYRTISTLDFLHEGALLRDGQDIGRIARIIPNTTSPQYVTPVVYKDLLEILNQTGNMELLKFLHISFAFPDKKMERKERNFEFEKTFRFSNLSKLVVHGPAADNSLLSAIGFWCKCLKYLDIRGTRMTEEGILLLLLKNPKDVSKFSLVPDYPNIPALLTALTKTLEYLDMSTVKDGGLLLYQDRIVRLACPRLQGTMDRVFFLPEGRKFFASRIDPDAKLKVLRNTVFSLMRGRISEAFSRILKEMRLRFHCTESVNALEIRRDLADDESVILFLHDHLAVMEFRLMDLTIVSILCHAKSSTNFLPLELLVRIMPNLREIKASLDGVVLGLRDLPYFSFRKLERVTAPVVKRKETLISLVRWSKRLVYLEVGEILHSVDGITFEDSDIRDMFPEVSHGSSAREHENLEVFRLHFQNELTLSPGLKDLIKFCPALKIVGDLSRWKISYNNMVDFVTQLNLHNCDLTYEYNRLLYHTSTPCKEFFR